MINKPVMPERGADPQFDRIREVIERCSLSDPAVTKRLLIAVLRFLRDKANIPGIPMSFDELDQAAAFPGGEAILFAINPENRSLVMVLADGTTKARVLEKMRGMMPNLEEEIILDSDGPDQ